MTDQKPAKPRRFLPLAKVIDRVGLGKTAIYERVARGEFPRPVPISGSTTVRWVESEVDDWMDAQVQARDQAA